MGVCGLMREVAKTGGDGSRASFLVEHLGVCFLRRSVNEQTAEQISRRGY